MQFLKKLDQFGVTFQSRIRHQTTQYKTSFGGLVTIILYGLSFSYFIYILVQWRTGQLLPKITSQSDVLDNYSFFQSDKYIEIGLRRQNTTIYDPFNPDSLILQPMLFVLKNGQVFKSIVPNFETTQLQNGFYTIIISNLSSTISETKREEFPEYEIMLAFGESNSNWLKNEQQCANQTQTDSFLHKELICLLQNNLHLNSTPNPKNQKLLEEKLHFHYNQIELIKFKIIYNQLKQLLIQDFYSKHSLVIRISMNLEYFVLHQIQNIMVNFFISYILFSHISSTIYNQNITFPIQKQVKYQLMLVQLHHPYFFYLLFIIINENYLYNETISSVISMYYPEFEKIKVTKTFYGTISKQKEMVKLLIQIFKELYQKWSIISEKKLSYLNQLYEISRLQFLLQQSQPSNIIQQIHQYGIPLPLFLLELDEGLSKQDISFNQDYQLKSNQNLQNVSSQSMAVSRNSMLLMQHQSDTQYVTKDSDFDLLVFSEQHQK